MMKIGVKKLHWNKMDKSKLNLQKLIEHFCQCGKAEGKSPHTCSWYKEMLSTFTKFLVHSRLPLELEQLTLETAREFIIYEQQRGMSPYTVQAKVRALKAFSSWLLRESYTDNNILLNLRLPKAPLKIVDTLTPDEINALISYQNPLTAIGARDIAILITLLDTGLRLSELSNLHFTDSHIEEGYMKVMGKGSKERIVPVGNLAQKVLWRYIFHFRLEPVGYLNDYLFQTLEGKQLSSNAIKLMLKRWGKQAGVPRLHAHLCRHTFATNYLVHSCGDVFKLQQILGHTTLEMVRKYIHFATGKDLIRGSVYSPVDRLGISKLKSYKIDRLLAARRY